MCQFLTMRMECNKNPIFSQVITGSMDGAIGYKIEGPHFESLFTEPFKELVKWREYFTSK